MSESEKIKDENKKLLSTVTNLFGFNILFFILGFVLSFLFFDILVTKIRFVNDQIVNLSLKIDDLSYKLQNLEYKTIYQDAYQTEMDRFNDEINRIGKEYQQLKDQQ